MIKHLKTNFLVCLVLLFVFIFSIQIVSAAPNLNYAPMEKIPGMITTPEYDKDADFVTFVSNLYK